MQKKKTKQNIPTLPKILAGSDLDKNHIIAIDATPTTNCLKKKWYLS